MIVKRYLAITILSILLVSQIGCSKSYTLQPYLAGDEVTYSIIFLAHDDDWLEETYASNQLYRDHFSDLSQVGVIIDDSKDGKVITKALNIKEYPTYILFDHQTVRVLTTDRAEFESQLDLLLQHQNNKMNVEEQT